MTGNENFETYKKIKNEIKTEYKGYPIEKIVALDLILKVYMKKKFTLKGYISFILKRTLPIYFSTLNIKGLNLNSPTSTLFGMGIFDRKDYYEIWEYAQSFVKDRITFDFSKQKYIFKLNFKNIAFAWNIISKTKRLQFIEKYWLAAKITHYLNVIDDLEKLDPKVGKYCAFSSVHEYEAILTYFFKKKGIPTYSLQHGLYTVYNQDIPLDAILYDNFTTDHHLCWGKATQDEFASVGIKKEALTVAGYSRELNRPPVPKKLNEKECLVMLARYSYHDSNFRLFEMMKQMTKQYGIKFHLKLHPSLEWNQFKFQYEMVAKENNWQIISQKETLADTLQDNKYGWAISVNSSAYYEAYLQYLPCLRYNDGTFEDMVDIMDDVFTNYKELKEKYKSIPFQNLAGAGDYFSQIDKNLDYAIGINTNKYDALNVV